MDNKCIECNSEENKSSTKFFNKSLFAINCEKCGCSGGYVCGSKWIK